MFVVLIQMIENHDFNPSGYCNELSEMPWILNVFEGIGDS